MTKLRIGREGFDSQQVQELFLFVTHPHIQRVPGSVSLDVRRPGPEADHSPPSSAEATPSYVFMA